MANAQDNWVLVGSHTLKDVVTTGDVSPFGEVFLGTASGRVVVLSEDGELTRDFSSMAYSAVTAIDAGNSLKTFLFYGDLNRFEFIDRFTAQPREYFVSDFGIGPAHQGSVDLSGNLWFLGQGKLTGIDIINRRIIQQIDVPEVYRAATHLHQTRLMVLVAPDHGVLVLDESGAMLSELRRPVGPVVDVQPSLILGLSGSSLWRWQLSVDTLELTAAPGNYDFVLQAANYYHFVKGSQVDVFQLSE